MNPLADLGLRAEPVSYDVEREPRAVVARLNLVRRSPVSEEEWWSGSFVTPPPKGDDSGNSREGTRMVYLRVRAGGSGTLVTGEVRRSHGHWLYGVYVAVVVTVVGYNLVRASSAFVRLVLLALVATVYVLCARARRRDLSEIRRWLDNVIAGVP